MKMMLWSVMVWHALPCARSVRGGMLDANLQQFRDWRIK